MAVNTKVALDDSLPKNQVKVHAVDSFDIGYLGIFEVYRGKIRELRDKRSATNGRLFFPTQVCLAMYGAACRHLFKRVTAKEE